MIYWYGLYLRGLENRLNLKLTNSFFSYGECLLLLGCFRYSIGVLDPDIVHATHLVHHLVALLQNLKVLDAKIGHADDLSFFGILVYKLELDLDTVSFLSILDIDFNCFKV